MSRPFVMLLSMLAGTWSCRATADDELVSQQALHKALALIARSAQTYTEERHCFSCHHQALPVFTLRLADDCGVTIDRTDTCRQSEFTHRHFTKRLARLAQGEGVEGGPYAAGYALVALAADQWPADDTILALSDYLRRTQEANGSWRIRTHRPPLEDSHFTATALAVRALTAYDRDDEKSQVHIDRARRWLIDAPATSHEDRVFRLFGLRWSGASENDVSDASRQILSTAHDNGGWASNDEREPDAYATGQALVALRLAGDVPLDHAAYQAGVRWLRDNQQPDGSWHVTSYSKPFQAPFESGFPHGKDQFISISGTCWATMAILLAEAGDRTIETPLRFTPAAHEATR